MSQSTVVQFKHKSVKKIKKVSVHMLLCPLT